MTPRAPSAPLLLVAALSVLLLVAGCTPGGSAQRSGRTVAHEFGETTVPAAPSRVVALDEAAAMSALAVGVRPAAVYTTWGSGMAQSVLAREGVELVRTPVGPPPSTETVLAARPDLVLLTSIGDRSAYDDLAPAVPTVPLPATTRPWQESLQTVGELLDRGAEADRVRTALDRRIAELRAAAGASPPTVTALISYSGTLAMSAPDSPSGLVMRQAGLRPTPPPGGATPPPGVPYVALSEEILPAVDADRVLVFAGGVYDAPAVTSRPLYTGLPAVRAGRSAAVLGEPWFATDPFSTWWTATDLVALLRGASPASAADAAARFEEFRAGTRP